MAIKAYRKKLSARWNKIPRIKKLRQITASPTFGHTYLVVSVVILTGSTLIWAILGAKLQLNNSDQLANAYLFSDSNVLHGAQFPGQHSFLLKWPLFYLIKVLHYTDISFIAVTTLVVLATVLSLIYILHRIEKRRLVLGTVCLATASVLLLVPSVPYSGALLPANMAMLTTRNIEYIFYIASLIFLVRARRIFSSQFFIAVFVLSLLAASDKLFLLFSIGGAALGIIFYGLLSKWTYVTKMLHWLLASGAAAILAGFIISLINLSGYTNISTGSATGPYGLVTNSKQIVLGTSFAISGLVTNFGANPAYSAVEYSQVPSKIVNNTFSYAGVSYLFNALALLGGIYGVYRVILSSIVAKKRQQLKEGTGVVTSILLIFSSVAAIGLFIASDHYYAVDARYLAIAFFAVVISGMSYISKKRWQPEQFFLAGCLLVVSIIFGVVANIHNYSSDNQALTVVDKRNKIIAQALSSHKVDVLIGDYWRVLPTRQVSQNKIPVLPLDDCINPRQILSSSAWQLDLHHKSFAYILSSDASLTGFPHCNLKDIVANYGRPNASYLVDGTLANPKEQLLFYDQGINKFTPKTRSNFPATLVPIKLDELPSTICQVPTLMNIVAHQDDDLLFLSPDLLHAIDEKHCVRTIYVTAGDAGSAAPYWLGRQQGSEAAYSSMMGTKDIWIERIIELSSKMYVTIATPRGNPHVSLIFMHLPDGNLSGQGFKTTGSESVERLLRGQVKQLHSVDGQSSYSSDDLTSALTTLMTVYRPTEIHTQSNFRGHQFPDHSDHMAVGVFAQSAYEKYEQQQFENKIVAPIKYYKGYPVHGLSSNLYGEDLARKEAAFIAYSKFDGGVCHSVAECDSTSTYGSYINRQYESPY